MNLVTCILDRDLLHQENYRTFARAIGRGSGFEADQAKHAGSVDNPAAMVRGVWRLGKELLYGVFAA